MADPRLQGRRARPTGFNHGYGGEGARDGGRETGNGMMASLRRTPERVGIPVICWRREASE